MPPKSKRGRLTRAYKAYIKERRAWKRRRRAEVRREEGAVQQGVATANAKKSHNVHLGEGASGTQQGTERPGTVSVGGELEFAWDNEPRGVFESSDSDSETEQFVDEIMENSSDTDLSSDDELTVSGAPSNREPGDIAIAGSQDDEADFLPREDVDMQPSSSTHKRPEPLVDRK